ncbi:MAG: response regulator [Litorimonas sp.]
MIQIAEEIELRALGQQNLELRQSQQISPEDDLAIRRIEMASRIQTATYSKNADKIRAAIREFEEFDEGNSSPSLNLIVDMYTRYVSLYDSNTSFEDRLNDIARFESTGSWLERYFALRLSAHLYAAVNQRQAALQKSQYAFQLIPKVETQDPYTKFARADIASKLAQLHTMQGNIDFAISNSIEYLQITKGESDPQTESDLLNNLVFVHALSRDHVALEYLSEQLLVITELSPASIIGLSEFRVAQAANMAGNYDKGLKYSTLAIRKSDHPGVLLQAKINHAIALAGKGLKSEALNFARDAGVNLEESYLLRDEARRDVLYLGFLIALGTDELLARDLYNRQLDVTAQKFLANSSRDTTAMVAELENSRERQIEREKAAARETRLQALTIDRQKKLNRTLIALSIFLALGTLSAILFIRYREKIVRKLEIKTVEAASAEKLKTEFLGMISHELRTPLNGIIGISDFLANYHEDPDIREKTGIVLRSGNELLSVVESLTDMARLDAGQLKLAPHDADLSLSLAEVPDLWLGKAEEKGLVFTHFIDPAIAVHNVDEDRMLQCLNILLENAVRFTESGRIHLHITGQNAEQDGLTGLTAIVADTGQGMNDVVQSRLFKPFMQADTSRKRTHMGTGLNLAIAYALAKMMGGNLTVNSREGRGSEFKLDIPLADSTGNVEKIESVLKEETFSKPFEDTPVFADLPILDIPVLDGPDAPQREVIDLMKPNPGFPSLHDVEELVLPTPKDGQQRILVVDDVDSNRDVLRLILESQGHLCSEAADGFAALSKLERQNFDVMVLDIHMTPLDGVETLHRLRGSGESYANIPVVALTADNAASTNAACMDAGADLFLTKPVRQDDLLRAISYLSQTQSTRILSQQG